MSADLSLVIPFYNEEENVSAVIAEARSAVPNAEIIAVDDGSQDRTSSLLDAEKGIRVIHFPKNLGQGPALYAGLLACSRPYAAMMDGDGQNDPADLPALLELIRSRPSRLCLWHPHPAPRLLAKARRLQDRQCHPSLRSSRWRS